MKRTPPRSTLAVIVLLASLMFACVSVQSGGQSGSGGERKDAPKSGQQNDSGFTVSETTVPTTPGSPATGNDGFTVGETAVPNK